MIDEQGSDYTYKDDLIRNYIQLIIHEALKLEPSENYDNHKNAASRIASVFLELLERQFPIESADRPLQLKSAQDYATTLAVHVNYLNRTVKEVTGKPTTAHIAERIVGEAKALLQHTDWSIAQIAYALGFRLPYLLQQLLQTGDRHHAHLFPALTGLKTIIIGLIFFTRPRLIRVPLPHA
jgi:AraC-like DNA-binding protein